MTVDFEFLVSEAVTLLGTTKVKGALTTVPVAGFSTVGSCRIDVDLNSIRGTGIRSITLIVEDSPDGDSWSTVHSWTFEEPGTGSFEPSSLQDQVRVRFTTAGGLREATVAGVVVVPARDASENGGSQFWEEATISAEEADWTDDGVGTWTFVGGVISQTDPTADSLLNYIADVFPSSEYVVDAEIKLLSGQDGGTAARATVTAGNGASLEGNVGVNGNQGYGGAISASGPGDGQDIVVGSWVDGSQRGVPFPTTVEQDEWHTLRAVSNGVATSVYLDGVYLFTQQKVTGGNDADPGPPVMSCDRFAVAAVGLVQYRNLKVWTRPLPA